MDAAKTRPGVSIVVAITRSCAIGRGNDLIVRIADDLKRFRALTKGHAIIMGRKTYESIGRPLPGRQNIVVTRDASLHIPGVDIAHSLDEALEIAAQGPYGSTGEIFVIGGGEIYRQALPIADKLYLTIVESDETGDVFFPDYSEFKKIAHREDRVDDETGVRYSWIDLER